MKRLVCTILLAVLMAAGVFAQESLKRFEMKSGFMIRDSELMGQKYTSKVYFDDYGGKFAEYIFAPSFQNGEISDILLTGVLSVNGKTYNIDFINKLKLESIPTDTINYLSLSDKIVEKYKIKNIGKEEVCGKLCDMYSLQFHSQGVRTKKIVWIWRGVTLKKTTRSLNVYTEQEATDIQIDVPIDSSVFTVPDFPSKPE